MAVGTMRGQMSGVRGWQHTQRTPQQGFPGEGLGGGCKEKGLGTAPKDQQLVCKGDAKCADGRPSLQLEQWCCSVASSEREHWGT